MSQVLDLSPPQKIHIIGIGGAGMSSLAALLIQMGHVVSGSDREPQESIKEKLEEMGAKVSVGHQAENVSLDTNIVAYSSAISDDNVELEHARKQNIKVYARKEILKSVCKLKKTLAVAGSHGKTTTTAMLAGALASINVSYLIGAELVDKTLGGHWNNKGEWLVVEADESDGTFLELDAELIILTSMDHDHIEHYGGGANLETAYEEFVKKAITLSERDKCGAILQIDDALLGNLYKQLDSSKCVSVRSDGENADFMFENYQSTRTGASATILDSNSKRYKLEIPLPGKHNISNATLAFAASVCLGVKPKQALSGLKSFASIKRRFEILGEVGDIIFIDDYAHTPQEIAATLATLKDWGREKDTEKDTEKKGRVVCAFQPHRYSRTQHHWESFSNAFNDCEVVVISDIYSAGEEKREGITGKLILNAVLAENPRKKVVWLPEKEDLVGYMKKCLRPGDIFITLNAGNLNQIGKKIYLDIKDGNI